MTTQRKVTKEVSIKQPSDMVLDGITCTFEYFDGTLQSILAVDPSGHQVRFAAGQYSGMRVLVPAPPTLKEVHVVTTNINEIGVPIREMFDDASAAYTRQRELQRAGVCGDVTITVEQVPVPEGEV